MKSHLIVAACGFVCLHPSGICDAKVVVTLFPRPDKPAVTAKARESIKVPKSRQDSRQSASRGTKNMPRPQKVPAAPKIARVRSNNSSHAITTASSWKPPTAMAMTAAAMRQTRVQTNSIKLDFIPVEERQLRVEKGFTRLEAPAGTYGVEGHGTASHMTFRTGEVLNTEELARWIRRDQRYAPGMTVVLFACDTGKGGRPFAQKLANEMRAPVVAPTERLWVKPGGGSFVAGASTKKLFGIIPIGPERPDHTRKGCMKSFHPGAQEPVRSSGMALLVKNFFPARSGPAAI